ncbi:MAG TPA: hypothetical protein VFI84_01500 [Candidatus Saccharimonadales bacterium]|nr:hypothetical protein [Candidatus Saccharimonadales bacterium]
MNIKKLGSKATRLFTAFALLAAVIAPVVVNELASAASYTLLSPRSVKLSTSATSATNVQYTLSFTTSSTGYTVNTLAFEVCTDPFIAASCTAPDATFNWNKATVTINSQSGITGLSVDTTDSTANKLVLTRTAGAIAGNTAVTIALGTGSATGVTNPSTLGTFYMRMYTLNNATGNTTGTLQDAGGVALSTANAVNITAKVQESLTFCAYTTASSNTCATVTSNAVNLGDANGILSNTTSNYTANAFFNVATNSSQAGTSVAVNLLGDTLKNGTNSIASSGTTCTADSTTATVAQFGIRLSTLGTGMAADNSYNCSAGNHKLDTANTTATGGQQIAHMTGANAESQNTVELEGKAATTTPAGIYTSALTFIAAATY